MPQIRPNYNDDDDDDIEFRSKFLKLFQKFNRSNVWSQLANVDEFVVSKISVGAVGLVFRCGLKSSNDDNKTVISDEIIIKCVPEITYIKCDPLELSVINTAICQSGIGPKLIYTDHFHNVYQFIQGTNYNYENDCNPTMVKQLAKLLARFHSLKVPISNDFCERWHYMFEDMRRFLEGPILLEKPYLELIRKNVKLHQKYYKVISKIDLIPIFNELIRISKLVNQYPMIFSHNDFNRNNRYVCNETQRIYLLDFDFSNYNYRGYDLGRYFSNFRHHDDMFGGEGFPDDNEMDFFLDEYRQEYSKCIADPKYLSDPRNSLAQLRLESKIFTLIAYGIDVVFSLGKFSSQPNDPQSEYYLNAAKTRWLEMEKYRKLFIEEQKLFNDFV